MENTNHKTKDITSSRLSSPSSSHNSNLVPDAITAELTLKIGCINRTSRKQISIVTFPFLLSEGFEVFQAKVNTCTQSELMQYNGDKHSRQDPMIYIKPGAHSKQAELVQLSPLNFASRIKRSYRNFLKRKGTDDFLCNVLVYVVKADGSRHENTLHTGILINNGSTLQQVHTFPSPRKVWRKKENMMNNHQASPRHAKRRRVTTDFQLSGLRNSNQDNPDINEVDESTNTYVPLRILLNNSVVVVQVHSQDLLQATEHLFRMNDRNYQQVDTNASNTD